MRAAARAALRLALLGCALALLATPAAAHDCATQADCEETTGYIGGIATIGGIIAIVTGILGTQLGGGVGGAAGGAVAEQPAPAEPAEPAEPEVPWDELIGATEPEMPGADAGEPGDPIGDLIDDLLGIELAEAEPAETTAGPDEGEEDPLAGEPGIDELVPADELLAPPESGGEEPAEAASGEGEGEPEEAKPGEEEPGQADAGEEEPAKEKGDEPEKEPVKPGVLEGTERFTEAAGATKDAAERVAGWGEELGENVDKARDLLDGLGGAVSAETRDKVGGLLDALGERAKHLEDVGGKVGDIAGEMKEYGDKAAEYMNAANDNFERTDRMGLTDDSSNFLAWWRVTFKGIGEATQKFVDGLTAPVKKVFGDKAGDMVKDALPVAEFGEELSKLPTSAAEHAIKAQRRDQIAENVGAVPKDDAGYIELDDLYPGRKWP